MHTRKNPLQNLTRNDAHPYGVVIRAAYIGNDGFPRNNRASYHSEQKPGAGIRGVDEGVLPFANALRTDVCPSMVDRAARVR